MIEILQYWGDKLRKEHEIDAIAITEWQLMYAQGDWWKIRAMELFHKLNKRKAGGENESSIQNPSAWLMSSIKEIRRSHPDYQQHNTN